ncbi:MAG TPA: hypothetical protein VJ579_00405 [Candidatus Paceibacterota bacterium]|nr:hypothetical protein [Candidatus Paceibacterota bacterium]
MEDHPPLFSPEELNGLPVTPSEQHDNVITFIPQETVPRPPISTIAPLTPVFNPAEIVTHPAPENTQLSLAEAAAKYKEMVGVWPNDELSEETIRNAISSVDAAEAENLRLMEITRKEDAEETRRLYRGQ